MDNPSGKEDATQWLMIDRGYLCIPRVSLYVIESGLALSSIEQLIIT